MGFLERVVADKVKEIENNKYHIPEQLLIEAAYNTPVRDFPGALKGKDAVIAEIKRYSPTVTEYRQTGPVDALAKKYADNGASAISIVTDTPNFGTTLNEVEVIRRAMELPVLVKDFIVDSYQMYEARAAGADCVLLIVRILDDEQLGDLQKIAADLGMATLFECHDKNDVARAIAVNAGLIGINSRDLDTLTVSPTTTGRLLESIPETITRVAESGISKREDIVRLTAAGADAFLIGTVLLQSHHPGRKLRELRGELPTTRKFGS